MSQKEKEATEVKKQEGGKEGKQFVPNTSRARTARKNANDEEDRAYDQKKEQEKKEGSGRQTRSQSKKEAKQEEQGGPEKDAEEEEQPNSKQNISLLKAGQKRGRSQTANGEAYEKASSKKQKDSAGSAKKKNDGTVGSKHDKAGPPAKQASKSRLPKKGQTVHWKALPGWVEGSVIEIARTSKEVDGKQVNATKDDPRIVLKSSSGKTAVHKPESVYCD
jgi:hypothetical protein